MKDCKIQLLIVIMCISFSFQYHLTSPDEISEQPLEFIQEPFDLIPNMALDSDNLTLDESYNEIIIPYGKFIDAPTYIEVYQNSTLQKTLTYKLPNFPFRGNFSEGKLYINNTSNKNYTFSPSNQYQPINYIIPSDYTKNIGLYNITLNLYHIELDKIITHNSILNVTNKNCSLIRYYDDFTVNFNSNHTLDWKLDALNLLDKINYKLFINNSLVQDVPKLESDYISYNISYLLVENISRYDKKIKLEIYSNDKIQTIDEFVITVAKYQIPENFSININPLINNRFILWETHNVKTKYQISDNLSTYSRIDIYLNGFPEPYSTKFNYSANISYDLNVDSFKIYDLLKQNILNPNKAPKNLNFSFLIIDEIGRYRLNNHSLYISDFRSPSFNGMEGFYEEIPNNFIKEDIFLSSEKYPNLNYTISSYWNSSTNNKHYFMGTTGENWQYKVDLDIYKRAVDCPHVLDGFYYNHEYIKGGVAFWVDSANFSAINFPITVEIKYPSQLNPDSLKNEPPLQLFHFIGDQNSPDFLFSWNQYLNITKTVGNVTFDERIINIDNTTVKFQIYHFGLYIFGIDALAYKYFTTTTNEDTIPGFFINTLIIFSFLSISYLIKKEISRLNKKDFCNASFI